MASEKSRRRSLFDNDNGGILFYNDSHKSQLPSDYLDKIKIEINQWEQLLQKCGKEDKLEYKKSLKKFRQKQFGEKVLSIDHMNFLDSVCFDNYIRRGNDFLKRVNIMMEQHVTNRLDVEMYKQIELVQEKINKEIFKDNSK